MEPFEGNGVFWRAERPDDRLNGHISYNSKTGASIELGGILGGLGEAFGPDTQRNLCGLIPGKRLVLLNAMQNGITAGSGLDSERFKCPLVLEGVGWEELGEPSFDRVEFELDLLPPWVGSPRFEFEPGLDPEGTARIARISLEPRELEEAEEGGLRLSLESRWSGQWGGLERAELTQQFVLTLTYSRARDLEAVIEDVSHVQNLVTMGMDSACTMNRVTGFRDDLVRRIGDEPYPQPVEIYLTLRDSPSEERTDTPRPLMGFASLGGLLTVIRWIQSARRLRPVTGGLMSIRYTPRMFVDNRYDNVIGAAETFDRLWFENEVRPDGAFRTMVAAIVAGAPAEHQNWTRSILDHANEPRLRDRLVRMCAFVEPVMGALVGDVNQWAQVVATLRNRLTHHDDGQTFEWEWSDVYFLGESVYVLVASSLLVACDVEAPVLMAIFDSGRISHLRIVLPAILERLAGQLPNYR